MSEDPVLYAIELEPEVRAWLETLMLADYRAVERFVDRLAVEGPLLPFPLASHLGDGLRELRVGSFRVTYWLAPGRRAVLGTTRRRVDRSARDAGVPLREPGRVTAGRHTSLARRRISSWRGSPIVSRASAASDQHIRACVVSPFLWERSPMFSRVVASL